jgi:hypothetical protein
MEGKASHLPEEVLRTVADALDVGLPRDSEVLRALFGLRGLEEELPRELLREVLDRPLNLKEET